MKWIGNNAYAPSYYGVRGSRYRDSTENVDCDGANYLTTKRIHIILRFAQKSRAHPTTTTDEDDDRQFDNSHCAIKM